MFKKMVQNHRYQQWKKGVVGLDEESQSQSQPFVVCENSKRLARPKLFLFLVILSFISFSFILAPLFFTSTPPTLSVLYSFGFEDEGVGSTSDVYASVCSYVSNGSICCDRSSIRSDICVMKGDVRTNSASSTITLYRTNGYGSQVFGASAENDEMFQHEKIKPYTRKWEKSVMDTIDELDLVSKGENAAIHQKCDVQHDVPAVFFSTGGYTGNLYHEFNDGILPLYITSQHFDKKVVFVILEYHDWWISKYENILSHLTEYPVIDFRGDNRTHCFPQAVVGLKIHDELTIDASLMGRNKTIRDFRDMLDRAYLPRIRGLIQEEEHETQLRMNTSALSPSAAKTKIEMTEENRDFKKPKVVIIARNDSRAILNEDSLVKMAQDIGFQVEVLRPQRTTELAKTYRALNTSDVMIGVHGAAMTHFLFMRPDSAFIQIIPLGTDWAADTYYGQPAIKLGLKYIGYKILPQESSLYNEYEKSDPVLTDPDSVNNRGWEFTKKIYLDRQNVRLNLRRFHKRLLRAYYYSIAKKNERRHHQIL